MAICSRSLEAESSKKRAVGETDAEMQTADAGCMVCALDVDEFSTSGNNNERKCLICSMSALKP